MTELNLYIMVTSCTESVEAEDFSTSSDNIMAQASYYVDQHILDHLKHSLPMKVTPETISSIGIRVYILPRDGPPNELDVPYQKFFDDYYECTNNATKEAEDREFKEYLRLKKVYGDKLVPEGMS